VAKWFGVPFSSAVNCKRGHQVLASLLNQRRNYYYYFYFIFLQYQLLLHSCFVYVRIKKNLPLIVRVTTTTPPYVDKQPDVESMMYVWLTFAYKGKQCMVWFLMRSGGSRKLCHSSRVIPKLANKIESLKELCFIGCPWRGDDENTVTAENVLKYIFPTGNRYNSSIMYPSFCLKTLCCLVMIIKLLL